MSLISYSGGLMYHWRAFKYSRTLWKNHRENVEGFLSAWSPIVNHPTQDLILVGPSAGYSIPANWLKNFKSITAVEPDPVARWLFEMRFKIPVQWATVQGATFDFVMLRQLMGPQSIILFCNVLGQLDVQNDSDFQKKLETFCAGKKWASYHDALSGSGFRWEADAQRPAAVRDLKKKLTDELREGVIAAQDLLELNAHSSFSFFPSAHEYYYWEWRLTPTQTHVIEACFG